VVWTYAVAPTVAMLARGTYTRTEANPPLEATSDQFVASVLLIKRISPRTRAYVGVRHQRFESDVERDYDESAVFAGVNYSFR